MNLIHHISPPLRSLLLMGSTALEHLGQDPMKLLTLIAQRLPGKSARRVFLGLIQHLGFSSLPLQVLVSLARGGSSTGLDLVKQALDQQQLTATRARQLVQVLLAYKQWDLASEVAAVIPPDSQEACEARALILQDLGEYSESIEVINAASRRRTKKLRRTLEAQLRILSEDLPALQAVADYQPQPNTVLHILTNSVPFTSSGYTKRTHAILRAQVAAGWQVHAVTRLAYPASIGHLATSGEQVIDGVHYHRLIPGRHKGDAFERLAQQAQLTVELAQRLKPAVLHTTSHFPNALVSSTVAAALQVPWVYEMRGFLHETWAAGRSHSARTSERFLLSQRRERQAAANADVLVSLGQSMLEEISSWGVDTSEALVVRNAVGQEFTQELIDPAEIRPRLGLDSAACYAGTVSSIVDYEGLDELVRSFAALVRRGAPGISTPRLLIVGEGAALPGLRELAHQLEISELVSFPGRVSSHRALEYLQALDVIAVPRKDSALTRIVTPLKPFEAMALGKHLVLSELPALREVSQVYSGALTTAELGLEEALAQAMIASKTERPERYIVRWETELAPLLQRYAELVQNGRARS